MTYKTYQEIGKIVMVGNASTRQPANGVMFKVIVFPLDHSDPPRQPLLSLLCCMQPAEVFLKHYSLNNSTSFFCSGRRPGPSAPKYSQFMFPSFDIHVLRFHSSFAYTSLYLNFLNVKMILIALLINGLVTAID